MGVSSNTIHRGDLVNKIGASGNTIEGRASKYNRGEW